MGVVRQRGFKKVVEGRSKVMVEVKSEELFGVTKLPQPADFEPEPSGIKESSSPTRNSMFLPLALPFT